MKRAVEYVIPALVIVALLVDCSANRTARGAEGPEAAGSAAPAAKESGAPAAKEKEEPKQPPATESKEAKEPKEPKPAAAAAKEAEGPKKPSAAVPTTHAVKRGPFQVEVALDGVFETQQMTEVVLRPEAWAMFNVLSAVEHGAEVKQGDVLVKLDMEKIDRAIDDLRSDQKTAELAIQLAQQQLTALEKTTPMDLTVGERSNKQSHEDFDYYFKVLRPLALKAADFSLKYSLHSLEYEEEELKQLEKMYKADDLTEETEEIVLKRAHNSVESARFMVERAKIFHDRTMKTEIPRDDVAMKDSIQRTDLQWSTNKINLPLTLQKQRLDIEKLKLGRDRSEEQLRKLMADRQAMTLKAPEAGIVYYGRCVRGKFGGAAPAGGDGLRRGSNIAPNDVFMTIVKPRPMFIRVTVPENQIAGIRTGVSGTAEPACSSDMKLTAVVDRVASVPMSAGGFDGRVTVALDPQAELLMPGMTCKVKLIPYQNKSAIAVPKQAVGTDELDPDRYYVCAVDKEGKQEKRYVSVGKRSEKQIEILAGLSEGDQILLECPKQ